MTTGLTALSWGPDGWLDDIAKGALITLSLALSTLPFGIIVGFIVALGTRSKYKILSVASGMFTTAFRALPELLTLFLIFYGLQIGLQKVVNIVDPAIKVEINAFLSGMIALAVVFGAYAGEVFVAAFQAVPPGQYEGAYSLGLTGLQTNRFIIIPQLIRIALPGISNLWMVTLKDTALISTIGLTDLLRQATVAARVTKSAFLFFGVAGFLYLVMAVASSIVIYRIDKFVSRGHRN
ncbi:ABC transporter permease subunit [Mesorhizobium sp.]|uniref:ABC transporter permease n=1 Tax=Mesorhizobium sp. TaxID=1871066 RepID=UPI000FE5B568|nr:ABC transporter permease subunit [Mesorhizobium sp.]RWI87920.1 MAG: ABC transporter permease subunit [Mesorhizobium sp.]